MPMMVIMLESASDRLLMASGTIAIEPYMNPTAALKAASSTFAMIPTTLVKIILPEGSIADSYSFFTLLQRTE